MWRASHRTWIAAAVTVLTVVGGTLEAPRPATAFAVRARNAGAYDPASGEWLYAQSIDTQVPVASLTKLAAALTFLRLNGDLDGTITITRADWTGVGRTRLRPGDRLPARTVLKLALVCSDNCAARALTHPFGLTYEAYGYRMQETAHLLGCRNSVFVEPTGLDERNRSTAREVVLLFSAALKQPVLREFMGTRQFQLDTRRGPRTIVHSSRLLRARHEIAAAKTGYIDEAGYCMVEAVNDPGGEFITVVLGAPTKRARTWESVKLIDHVRRARKKGF